MLGQPQGATQRHCASTRVTHALGWVIGAGHRTGVETPGGQHKWTGWRGTQGHTSGEPRQPPSGDPPAKRLVSQPFPQALQGVEELVPAAFGGVRKPGCRRHEDGRYDRTPGEPPNRCMSVTRWFTPSAGQLRWTPDGKPPGRCGVQLQWCTQRCENLQVGSPNRP